MPLAMFVEMLGGAFTPGDEINGKMLRVGDELIVEAIVPEVDVAGRRIVVTPPPGLLDEPES